MCRIGFLPPNGVISGGNNVRSYCLCAIGSSINAQRTAATQQGCIDCVVDGNSYLSPTGRSLLPVIGTILHLILAPLRCLRCNRTWRRCAWSPPKCQAIRCSRSSFCMGRYFYRYHCNNSNADSVEACHSVFRLDAESAVLTGWFDCASRLKPPAMLRPALIPLLR